MDAISALAETCKRKHLFLETEKACTHWVRRYLVTSGQLTPRLFALSHGKRLWLGPKAGGLFTLDRVPAGQAVLFIATGTGLAPYMSMLRTMLLPETERRFVVLHGARYGWDLGYRAELESLARLRPNLTYITSITRPDQDPHFRGHTGRVQHLLEKGIVERESGVSLDPARVHAFLSGNPGMIQVVRGLLEARGFQADHGKEIGKDAVAEAFLLKALFRDLMNQHGACAVTTNGCMGSYAGIMPCLTLTLTNDDGYMAYCESDFVNIPAGILMHYIAGRPTYFCSPTFPHEGRMLFAHCTAPRRMDGQKLEPVTLVTHYESDHGAATHVHFPKSQPVTVIKPDFEAKHWLALTGKIVDSPFLATCRAQIEIALDADTQDVIRNMRGFHCQIAYGDWTREVAYAAKKVGIEVQRLPKSA